MKTLYLVRHTAPRIAPGLCYGQLDVDVADSFGEEANAVLQWLPPIDQVVTSPLLRARRLGECLARERCCELRSDARLMEKHFGSWEGKDWDNIPRAEIDAWAADIMGYAPPGGESALQLQQRVQGFMRDLAKLPGNDIAIVAHGGSIRALLALIAGISLPRTIGWKIEYGTVICARLLPKGPAGA